MNTKPEIVSAKMAAAFGARAPEAAELVEACRHEERKILVVSATHEHFEAFRSALGRGKECERVRNAKVLNYWRPATAVVVKLPGWEGAKRFGVLDWAIEKFNAKP